MPTVPGLDHSEIEKFMTEKKIPLSLGAVDETGEPIIYPVWFLFVNDSIFFFTNNDTRKVKDLGRTKRVYFSIDTESDPLMGVKGKARATILRDIAKSQDIFRKIIMKYMGDAKNSYAKSMLERIEAGTTIVVELSPIFYSTWDYGKT
jgi:general stress protein 26